jgi:hypothetical protein
VKELCRLKKLAKAIDVDNEHNDQSDETFVQRGKGNSNRSCQSQNKSHCHGEEVYEGNKDKVFTRFKKILSRYPTQCIRWCPNGRPIPIHDREVPPQSGIVSKMKNGGGVAFCADELLPRCECGAKRVFELQLLPTVIYYLDIVTTCGSECDQISIHRNSDGGAIKNCVAAPVNTNRSCGGGANEDNPNPNTVATPSGLSFGTISVYTCASHCGTGLYRVEHVHWQSEL